ncbi:hypothetical protein FGE20_02940 [Elizabethkingia sp. JS20170427COW]|nr:hypothetical protein FGE20_02940 [Elizabethkingia sp. JS20170427COW]
MASKAFRWIIVIGGIAFFSWWFFKKSVSRFLENSLSVQVVNKLPQELDLYTIKVNSSGENLHIVNHLGNIRKEHFRIEYLNVKNSNEYWIMGFDAHKKLVYFSQHSILNKNEDQKVELRSTFIQSQKLAEIGKKEISEYLSHLNDYSIWVTFDLLLLFLNLVLLLKKETSKSKH